MSDIPAGLRRLVVDRARGRCEYCRLPQLGQEATFHVDHILPRSAGGPTRAENLALACVSSSLRKEARLFARDPATGSETALFHPRLQRWSDHFRWKGIRIAALTPTGRATLLALQMNRLMILAIRGKARKRERSP